MGRCHPCPLVCLVPALDFLPSKCVDCMTLRDIYLSKLIENAVFMSSEILHHFLVIHVLCCFIGISKKLCSRSVSSCNWKVST